jgi:hypothetical protein
MRFCTSCKHNVYLVFYNVRMGCGAWKKPLGRKTSPYCLCVTKLCSTNDCSALIQTKLQPTFAHDDDFQNILQHILRILTLDFTIFGLLFHQVVLTTFVLFSCLHLVSHTKKKTHLINLQQPLYL